MHINAYDVMHSNALNEKREQENDNSNTTPHRRRGAL
jgi:hypothetical protein